MVFFIERLLTGMYPGNPQRYDTFKKDFRVKEVEFVSVNYLSIIFEFNYSSFSSSRGERELKVADVYPESTDMPSWEPVASSLWPKFPNSKITEWIELNIFRNTCDLYISLL